MFLGKDIKMTKEHIGFLHILVIKVFKFFNIEIIILTFILQSKWK